MSHSFPCSGDANRGTWTGTDMQVEGGAATPELDAQTRVLALADEAAAEVGVEVLLARVRQGNRGSASVVITVDREGGVDIDAITAMSHALSDRLDRDDPIAGSYVLEVESPGELRPLRLPRDATRFAGQRVDLALSGGPSTRRLSGVLLDADDGCVRIQTSDGPEPEIFPIAMVEDVRLAKPEVVHDPRKPGARRHGSKGRHA